MKKNKYIFSIIILFTIVYFGSTNLIYALTPKDENSSKEVPEKIVYLTFDDGPGGKTTLNILDTLKDEGVPATFFVIGSQIEGQEETILRMKDEGHSIGLHSFSHNRSKLYCNNECFLKEMLDEQTLLQDVTGEKFNILRFPFGCNNNTYKLNQSMIEALHDNNFKIYDWTTDSGDGANHNSPPTSIIKNSCSHNNKDLVVVLMHCSYLNKNTAKALPEIIKFYKSEGYVFKGIDDTTPEVYKLMKK